MMTNEQRIEAVKNIMKTTTETIKNAKTEEEKMNAYRAQNMMLAMLNEEFTK